MDIENGLPVAAAAAPGVETHRMVSGKLTEEQYQALVSVADQFGGTVLATSSFVLREKRARRIRRRARARDRVTRKALLRAQKQEDLEETVPEPSVDLLDLMSLVLLDPVII